ncbi:STM4014 family protein [Paenibacillus sp. WLX2291]|uniref:STM4014 family protein n=1 Tax=Paenibacillus sp. WLX2291 TaxID=3296934 RepID=UPI003984526F
MTATLSRTTNHILFGNPGNKRTAGWQQALSYHGRAAALEVPYVRLLHAIRAGESLPEVMEGMSNRQQAVLADEQQPLLLRLDAPGDDFAVERGLIALGAEDAEGWNDDDLVPLDQLTEGHCIPAAQARTLPPQHGRIFYPAQWFRGYCRLLSWLQQQVSLHMPQAQWLNAPADVALMFDKRACSHHLATAGVAVPPILSMQDHGALHSEWQSGESNYETLRQQLHHAGQSFHMPTDTITSITGYEHLHQSLKQQYARRVFVKLFCGSAASGVIAYQYQPHTGAEIAMTTIGMEQVNGETIFYNSGRLIRYTQHDDIRRIVDWLAVEGIHVERWVSKDMINGKAYDVRQLVCREGAGHAVARLSRTPITNLHLRNERIVLEDCQLPPQTVDSISAVAMQALSCFAGSFCAGMDVLVPQHGGRPLIMDVNPFGDLLYHIRHRGMSPYEWELDCLLRQLER